MASLPSPAGELDDPREAPPLHTLLEVARRGQPALATRRRALIQAQAGLALARREAWPKPTLGLRVDREGSADGAGETALRGTLTLPLPLFHTNQEVRARARVEVGIEQAALTAAEQVLEARLSRLAGDVDAAAASLIAYGATVVPKLEENLKMLQRAYELGEVDVLQLSVARERFLGVQNDSLDAYADYFSAVAELEEAVGADLWPEERSDHTKGEESRNE